MVDAATVAAEVIQGSVVEMEDTIVVESTYPTILCLIFHS
jgi:hypothetical protein